MSAPVRFGRYRVERRIGSGSFATVWLARDEVLDSPVAVKVLAENWAHRLDVRERFLEEARILRRADSDRVVRVHDLGELEDGRPYFVMTYADRGTLADRLADGPLPVPVALRFGADVARGLAVLHGVGVIHRDVNPANMLLRSGRDGGDERVLVADLGLAKAAAHGSGFTLTVGTPGYMAPEQAVPGSGLDRRADVYSVGALVHHLLTGVPPEPDRPPRPPRELRPELPPAVDAVVRQALAARPEDRHPSAGALADALDAAAIGAAGSPPATRIVSRTEVPAVENTLRFPASAPGRRPRGRRAPLLGLVALLLAGAAGGGLLLVRSRADVTVTGPAGLTITVPAAWAEQRQDGPWDLTPYGAGTSGVGLAVSPEIGAWRDAASGMPGVFVGRADGLPAATLLARLPAACPPARTEPWQHAGLTGAIRRQESCPASALAVVDGALQPADRRYTVYVQVRAPSVAAADRVLDSLGPGPGRA